MLSRYQGTLGLIAEDDQQQIRGMLTAVSSSRYPDTVYLWQIGVRPDSRQVGLGYRLLRELQAVSVRAGYRKLEASIAPENAASQTLLRRFAEASGVPLQEVGSLALVDRHYPITDRETIYRVALADWSPSPQLLAGEGLEVLRLFIYGNLLPGRPLSRTITPYVVNQERSQIPARLYWHAEHGFPVAVSDPDSTVHGLCVTLRADPMLWQLLASEELGFGYEARRLTPTGPNGQELAPALTFLWPWADSTLGEQIPSGQYGEIEEFKDQKEKQ